MHSHINKLEDKYRQNDYKGYLSGPATLAKLSPSSNVLLVAKHSVRHWKKDGSMKIPDLRTGSLVEYLHKYAGCSFISSIRTHRSIDSYVCETPHDLLIKQLSANKSLVVLDIHGMKKQDFSIAVGFGDCLNEEQNIMIEGINNFFPQYDVAINPPGYLGNKVDGIVERTKIIGIPAVLQIELGLSHRTPETNQNFLSKMKKFILYCENLYN